MEFFSQLFASAIGGAIAGYFVVVGVNLQFRHQSRAALRALMLEVSENEEAALDMTQSAPYTAGNFELGRADPGWLKRSIWDSQLPLIIQLLDDDTLKIVGRAYSLLEAVPAMVKDNVKPGASHFYRGGWVDTQLVRIQTAFSEADKALENLQNQLVQEADRVWYHRLVIACQKFSSDLRLRLNNKLRPR